MEDSVYKIYRRTPCSEGLDKPDVLVFETECALYVTEYLEEQYELYCSKTEAPVDKFLYLNAYFRVTKEIERSMLRFTEWI